jgi:hypothetical protein
MQSKKEEGELLNDDKLSIQWLNLLVKAGFALFGNHSKIQFANKRSTRRLDQCLRELLLDTFEQIDATSSDNEDGYAWWLLKASHSHLQFHHETPDGYDFISAKGGKSKGWQEAKLYFGKWICLTIVSFLNSTTRSHSHSNSWGHADSKREGEGKVSFRHV